MDPDAWRAARTYLDSHRHPLAQAAAHRYPGTPRIPGTTALTRPEWLPPAPIDLAETRLTWAGTPPPPPAETPAYADTLAVLAPPALLEDRPTYRLLHAPTPAHLTYGTATYFDGLNTGEAVAHELAEAVRQGRDPATARLPRRDRIGDPTDPGRRPMTTAISMLTLRRAPDGTAAFPLHRRDAKGVAHGGGLVHVVPVGVFQPSGPSPATVRADLDLWRCAVREYAEEFLGAPEHYPEPFAYGAWPPYRDLTAARTAGHLRTHLLGIAVDPLSLATDLLAVTVIDAAVHDRVFARTTRTTPEGTLTGHHPFTYGSVAALLASEPFQAAGAAVLTLALRHRRRLGV
ncbi:MAG TPA: hypothetical protein VGL93_18935 [Streptosporangiaceae bacterium]|jgi:hypothetical protein